MPPSGEALLLRGLAAGLGHEDTEPLLGPLFGRLQREALKGDVVGREQRLHLPRPLEPRQHGPVILIQRRAVQQFGPSLERQRQRLFPPPGGDVGVVAAQKHPGHLLAPKVGGPGVLRVFLPAAPW